MGIPFDICDAPEGLTCSEYHLDSHIENVIIFLHGFGDNHQGFHKLAENLKLEQTSCISIRAPHVLPLSEALVEGESDGELEYGHWMWYKDIAFNSSTGEIDDHDGDFRVSLALLNFLVSVLIQKYNFTAKDIYLFGYGQGAVVAMEFGRVFNRTKEFAQKTIDEDDIGGIIAVAGVLAEYNQFSYSTQTQDKRSTNILLCSAPFDCSKLNSYEISRIKAVFSDVSHVIWEDKEKDSMPLGRQQWYPIMTWLGKRLMNVKLF